MDRSDFFKIDKSVVLLLFLVVILIISIIMLVNYQRTLVLSHNADTIIAAIPTRSPSNSKVKISATPTPDFRANWKEYENREYGFMFRYPEKLNAIKDPHFDGRSIVLITDDTRETVTASGWFGIFVAIKPNPSNYDSKSYIEWQVKNDPLNSGVKIKKANVVGIDASITQGEVVNNNGEIGPKVYISKGDSIILLTPNHSQYFEILSQIIPTFNFL
ncbi:MAG TPA: hypothetical protein VN174_00480 [Candidatus Methanoperedens sp.]|nr:hypothetical protein [Candidatus Methanoperedens sp.]